MLTAGWLQQAALSSCPLASRALLKNGGGYPSIFSFWFCSPELPPPAQTAQRILQLIIWRALTIWTPNTQTHSGDTCHKCQLSFTRGSPNILPGRWGTVSPGGSNLLPASRARNDLSRFPSVCKETRELQDSPAADQQLQSSACKSRGGQGSTGDNGSWCAPAGQRTQDLRSGPSLLSGDACGIARTPLCVCVASCTHLRQVCQAAFLCPKSRLCLGGCSVAVPAP